MEVCFCYFCNIETALSEDGLWAPMSQNCSSNGLLEKKVCLQTSEILNFSHWCGWWPEVQAPENQPCIFMIAERLSWLHLKSQFSDISYGIKLQLSRNISCKGLCCYCFLHNSIQILWSWCLEKESGFYDENQNFIMLNLQVSSLKLQIQTAFRWLWSSGLTTGKCTFQGDLSRWPKILSWSWGEKVDSGYKGFQEIQVSNPGDGSELWPCKPSSGMGNKQHIILLKKFCLHLKHRQNFFRYFCGGSPTIY